MSPTAPRQWIVRAETSFTWASVIRHLEESEKFLRRAWSLDRNPEIAAHLGEVLWLMGKEEDARSIWREGKEVDSENPVLQETIQRLEVEF